MINNKQRAKRLRYKNLRDLDERRLDEDLVFLLKVELVLAVLELLSGKG
jgi:hypothetical protein